MTRHTMFSALAAVFFAATPALAVDFTPQSDGVIDFDMPSGNMCCSLIEDHPDGPILSCTRVAPKYWIVTMQQDGQYTLYKNPGEVPGCGYGKALGNIFEYGETWNKAGFSCTSATNGVRCFANGRGFRLSRAGLKKYN